MKIKSVNERFPVYPLPSHHMGDGKLIIMIGILACVAIIFMTVAGVLYAGAAGF